MFLGVNDGSSAFNIDVEPAKDHFSLPFPTKWTRRLLVLVVHFADVIRMHILVIL